MPHRPVRNRIDPPADHTLASAVVGFIGGWAIGTALALTLSIPKPGLLSISNALGAAALSGALSRLSLKTLEISHGQNLAEKSRRRAVYRRRRRILVPVAAGTVAGIDRLGIAADAPSWSGWR